MRERFAHFCFSSHISIGSFRYESLLVANEKCLGKDAGMDRLFLQLH